MKLRIVKKRGENNSVLLSMIGELTIYTVGKLKDVVLKELESFSGIIMNMNEISEADTAGFQLILFLKREAEAAGKTLEVAEASARLKSLFSLYNENI